MPSFNKILIANRGEIAVRVMRTAKALGYRTVAVYSDADADALHTQSADEAVRIGPPAVGESYLNIAAVIEAAQLSGADAVHPGYGFLSENTDFARACEQADIVFIGPPSPAIELMGSKRLSKIAMLQAGVPCIPGYEGDDQTEANLIAQAKRIGTPLMIKASAGGGGRGMRLVTDLEHLGEHIRSARSEAQNAFGSGELILERAVLRPRHIEIQVFGDTHGNYVYLGERDCSIQRRHQKVVEEAPSPFVTAELRKQMGEAAVAAARACNYVGAGTVEFLVDQEHNFYFLEMNTRLQVEHPVTELVTGVDLVAWQIQIAAGALLPLAQNAIQIRGHAVEVRLYAEDPRANFMPQTGTVKRWRLPQLDGLRIDAGIREGQVVSPFYDPMLAKVIAYGEDRATACRRLATALEDICLFGVETNKLFVSRIMRHGAFLRGEATTAFIAEHFSEDISQRPQVPAALDLALAAAILQTRAGVAPCWRSSIPQPETSTFAHGETRHSVAVTRSHDGWLQVEAGGESLRLRVLANADDRIDFEHNGIRRKLDYLLDHDTIYFDASNGTLCLTDITHAPPASADAAGNGEIKAPMDGAIVAVLCEEGQPVTRGQTLLVLEAMKMETQIKANVDGIVAGIHVGVGMQVKTRQLLALVRPNDEA